MKFYQYLLIIFLGMQLRMQAQTITPGGNPLPTATANKPAAYTNPAVSFIRTWEPSMPATDTAVVADPTRTIRQVKQTTQYLDGLGRPLETVIKGISPSGKDLVTPMIYDGYGREQYKYLPYVQQSGSTSDGSFKNDPFSGEQAFYQDAHLNRGTIGESVYYSEVIYEASPLNRVLSTYAPGNSWAKAGGNRPVQTQYLTNTVEDSVRIWNVVNNTVSTSGIYAVGALYKNVTIDEAGTKLVEYKDQDNRMILRKIQLSETPGTAHVGWLCTYYVYDDIGNLCMVIPPLAVQKINSSWNVSTVADELCFQYQYDARDRMVVKKIPGAGAVYTVYDNFNRPVFTQDAVQRNKSPQQWLVNFYDEINRPIETALYSSNTSREALQAQMNTVGWSTASESYTLPGVADLVLANYDGSSEYKATNSITFEGGFESSDNAAFTAEIDPNANNGTTTVQALSPFPNLSPLTPLTYTYYDDYSYTGKLDYVGSETTNLRIGNNSYPDPVSTKESSRTNGLVTGKKVRVLDTDQWLATSVYYDDKGRVIQSISQNNVGGKDILTHQYDFSGKVLSSYLDHNNVHSSSTPKLTVLSMMDYDGAGRLLSIKKRLNGDSTQDKSIVINSYDELGRLLQKRLGVTASGGQLDTITYTNNIRGWITGINQAFVNANSATDWFGEEVDYASGFSKSQYNGNISGVKWKSGSDNVARAYGYDYDRASRLLKADFGQQNTAGATWTQDKADFSVSNLAYDANGNINSMTQKGLVGNASVTIDQLTYIYKDGSNKLMRVNDPTSTASAKLGDFINGTNTGDDYNYDANGNLIQDMNKGISSITYNLLNLPAMITITGKGSISYQYDATGVKLKKTVVDNTVTPAKTTVTDYADGFVYQQDSLQYLSHEEGRIRPVFKLNQPVYYTYDYFEKDHLGNVRVVLGTQSDTSVYAATMEPAAASKENALFSNLDATRTDKPSGYPADDAAPENKSVAKLNAKDGGRKIGPSLVLKVMAGDTIQIGSRAFYKSEGPSDNKPISADAVLAALVQAFGAVTTGESPHAGIAASANTTPFTGDFYNNYQELRKKDPAADLTDRPKAYLNFVLFDDQFKLVDDNSGVKQVQKSPDELQTLATDKMVMKKSGFLYVYTSNETQQDVFFDNLIVNVNPGPLLEETHYYPYGLTMAGISKNALKGSLYPENREKYNGIEYTNELDLDIYDAQFRNLDPQIGRWNQIDPKTSNIESWSPYVAMSGNPVRYSDLPGDSSVEPKLTPKEINQDGDQKGLIINATEDLWKQNPAGAALVDFSHFVLDIIGLNTLDDYVTNRVTGQNSPEQLATETLQLGIALSASEDGGAPVPTALDGSFSMTELGWKDYPTAGNVPRPKGPFRLLEGAEYNDARKAANAANRNIHQTDPASSGKDIHEVHPVKFDGSPTDPANKVYLSRSEHSLYTNFWNDLRKTLTGK